MLIAAATITLVLVLVPLFRLYAEYGRAEAQEQIFIILASAGLCVLLLSGALPVPGLAGQALLALAGYSAISLLWADRPRPAAKEVARLVAVAAFVCMASMVPSTYLIAATVAPVPVIIVNGLWQQFRRKDLFDHRWDTACRKKTRFLGWFDSTNHCGNFLAMQAFLAAYLGMTYHAAFWLMVAACGFGVWLSRCRAAQLALVIGAAAMTGEPIILAGTAVLCVTGVAGLAFKGRVESFGHRFLLIMVALHMIKEVPWGGGPRYFRRKFCRVVGGLNEQDPTILGDQKTPGRYLFVQGRRAHNDLLEMAVEYGPVGVALFVLLFFALFSGAWHPAIVGAVAAALVSSLLFYPLRDIALGLPILSLAGAVAPAQGLPSFHPVFLLVTVPALLLMTWRCGIRPLQAQLAFMKRNLWKAVRLDPIMGRYVHDVVVLLATRQKDPATAMAFAQRAIYDYDGECLEHAVFLTYGQVALLCKALPLALKAFTLAASMRPGDEKVQYELKRVQDLIAYMEDQHGKTRKMVPTANQGPRAA